MNTHRFFLGSYFAIFLIVVIGAFWVSQNSPENPDDGSLVPLTLALDWTPNTNHTGLYVALHEKWYEEDGIALIVLPYGSVSPDVLVGAGKADLGISSTEAVVASSAAGTPVISVAAIIAHNTSSLVVRKDSGITGPSELDGKIYGGYGASYEEAVIGAIIKKDGGKGVFKNVVLDVDAFEALRAKRIDFTWIFDAWQGIQAKREGFLLTSFPIREYGIPDYSTPNIITSPETLEKKKELLRKFIRATARGYEYARTHPRESAQMLIDTASPGTFPDQALVFESQEYLSPLYADSGKPWGVQEKDSWRDYPAFMVDSKSVFDTSGVFVGEIDFDSLYTNELFE